MFSHWKERTDIPSNYLNTLYVQQRGSFIRLSGDTVVVETEGDNAFRTPINSFGSLVMFSGVSASIPCMDRLIHEGKSVVSLSYSGRFNYSVFGPTKGNILLRLSQYETYKDRLKSALIAKVIVGAKVRNSRFLVGRAYRDSTKPEATDALGDCRDKLGNALSSLEKKDEVESIRGIEGESAACYFKAFKHAITNQQKMFSFTTRNRRPPKDHVNAVLSFLYSIVTHDCKSALEAVGLDPQLGFLHEVRPGRPSLALDLVEEFRAPFCDRLTLNLINRKQLQGKHFDKQPGSVLLSEEGRKVVITEFQKRKASLVKHDLFKNDIPIGLVPLIQARILARSIRGELDFYLPYISR